MAPQIIFVAPQGRLDALYARQLDTEIQQHIAEGHTHLVVDFQATHYISSHGLRVLLAVQKQAQGNGGGLKLCNLSPRLFEIFEMAGFDRMFEIFETREQAEQAFTQ